MSVFWLDKRQDYDEMTNVGTWPTIVLGYNAIHHDIANV